MENGGRFKTRFNELIVEIAETNIILKYLITNFYRYEMLSLVIPNHETDIPRQWPSSIFRRRRK